MTDDDGRTERASAVCVLWDHPLCALDNKVEPSSRRTETSLKFLLVHMNINGQGERVGAE